VHLLGPPEDAETRGLLDKVSLLDPADRRRVLKVGHVDGRPLIVTKFISDFSSISTWLEIRVDGRKHGESPALSDENLPLPSPPPEAAVPADPPSAPASSSPGEFTRMFEAGEPQETASRDDTLSNPSEDASLVVDPSARVVDPSAGPVLPSLDDDGPGEFTRMFQAEEKSEPQASSGLAQEPPPLKADPPSPTPLSPTPSSAPIPDPGQNPVWGGPLEDAVPSAPKEAGSFTRMFRQPALREGVSNHPSNQPSPLDPVAPPQQETSPPNWNKDDVYLERLRGGRDEPPSLDQPAPAQPPRPAVPEGPGEYTRVIQAASMKGSSAQPPLPPPPPRIPPPVSKGPPQKKLIAIGALVVVLALVVVFVFALIQSRANASDEAPEQEQSGETGV